MYAFERLQQAYFFALGNHNAYTLDMNIRLYILLLAAVFPGHISCAPVKLDSCPNYTTFSQQHHEPYSPGAYALSYMRPEPRCRTFNSSAVEDAIVRMNKTIADPDLFRLFENTYPSTLDTAIKWKGVAANNTEEELCFVITVWLTSRDP